jgi:hypothetical protein
MEKHPLIRTIYLYLFTIVGLALLTAGGVRFVNMGLKAFVFTKADEPQRIQQKSYISAPIAVERVEKYQEGEELSAEEKAAVKQWLEDYKKWQEESAKIDYVVSERHRDAATNLAMILIGLPLYLYHWSVIKKETKEKNQV